MGGGLGMAASTAPRQVGKRLRLGLAFALFAALALSIAPSTPLGAVEIEGLHSQGASDLDARTGSVAPTSDQLASVAALNAHATWNSIGTPQSLIKYGGYPHHAEERQRLDGLQGRRFRPVPACEARRLPDLHARRAAGLRDRRPRRPGGRGDGLHRNRRRSHR